MKSYVLYGITSCALEDAVRQVEEAIGIKMQRHESGYRGQYYRSGSSGFEHFLLQPNYLPHEDEWVEGAHQEIPFLLYLNETTKPEFFDQLLRCRIQSLVLLKREDL